MRSGELEPGLLVPRQRKRGRRVTLDCVAALAAVQQRRGGKLPAVRVLVTIHALSELDLVSRCRARWYVTARALDFCVRALQGISAGRVVLDRELGGLEAIHRVAGFAFAAVFAFGELSAVRVRPVTVGAERECDLGFEVAAAMAFGAIHRAMLAQQGEAGLAVVELRAHSRGGELLPSGRGVARGAVFLESPVMRVVMAGRT